MAAPLVVPFNFQPTAVSVKTGSYTIPVGSYARVIVNLEGSATFTIGGVTALRGTQNNVKSVNSSAWKVTGTPSRLTGDYNIGHSLGSSAGGPLSTSSPGFIEIDVNAVDQKALVADLWIPTGTTMNGTGTWRAIVMLYNELT